jgi:hypothetical protein
MWLRAAILVMLGAMAWGGGNLSAEEAQKYKKGIETIDIQSLGARFKKYDYLNTKGFSDGNHVYLEITKTRNGIETGKEYVLYYPLMNKNEFSKQINGANASEIRPTLIVRQDLKDAKCINSQDGCLEIGTRGIKGRAMTAFTVKGDVDAFKKLQKDYQMDAKTPVFDANWTPSTASDASFLLTLGKLLVAVGLIAIPVSLSLRRRNQAQPSVVRQG